MTAGSDTQRLPLRWTLPSTPSRTKFSFSSALPVLPVFLSLSISLSHPRSPPHPLHAPSGHPGVTFLSWLGGRCPLCPEKEGGDLACRSQTSLPPHPLCTRITCPRTDVPIWGGDGLQARRCHGGHPKGPVVSERTPPASLLPL